MCGIAGYLDPSQSFDAERASAAIERMSRSITHRGPDDGGCFIDISTGIALTNRRLAVIDLTPQGHQPMQSACGRYVIVFNGEIYNHGDLRKELTKARGNGCFRGHSDTETLLEAMVFWGVREALQRSVGMFALALWDKSTRTLTLSRDRIGEKPLYFGWSNGVFLFGSELKALRQHPQWNGEIDLEAEALYFQYGYVPSPRSIYAGIGKLPPGMIAVLNGAHNEQTACHSHRHATRILSDPRGRVQARLESYWTANAIPKEYAARSRYSEREATARLDSLLRKTITRQMLADVPVGILLSGGIDSSLVAAIAQAESSRAVRTFTIGFEDRGYDESSHAEAVARHLGTDHATLFVSPREASDVIPMLPQIYDEPFSDSSGIPTYLVSRLARSRVTVALSGDGGDEVFGGYNRHYWAKAFWSKLKFVPVPVRELLSQAILTQPPEKWDAALGALAKLSPVFNHRGAGEKMHKLAGVLPARSALQMDELLVTGRWPVKPGAPRPHVDRNCPDWLDLSEQIMLMDLQTYLPDDILVKVDRAAMAVSLETRAPFLDHEIVEFAWGLPVSQKIRGKIGKWLPRQVLYRYVPRTLLERPKAGFGIPVGHWLRSSLRNWAESLLAPDKLRRQNAVNPDLIQVRWKEHLSGKRNWIESIWCVLIYQAWLDDSGSRCS